MIANGMSGTCTPCFIHELYTTVQLLIDGTVEGFGPFGAATMVLPGVGSHAIRLEYNVFDCPDTFYDETLDFTAGDRILLAAPGRRGTERVTAIDLRGRSDLLASQLPSSTSPRPRAARRMWSMAPVACTRGSRLRGRRGRSGGSGRYHRGLRHHDDDPHCDVERVGVRHRHGHLHAPR